MYHTCGCAQQNVFIRMIQRVKSLCLDGIEVCKSLEVEGLKLWLLEGAAWQWSESQKSCVGR